MNTKDLTHLDLLELPDILVDCKKKILIMPKEDLQIDEVLDLRSVSEVYENENNCYQFCYMRLAL